MIGTAQVVDPAADAGDLLFELTEMIGQLLYFVVLVGVRVVVYLWTVSRRRRAIRCVSMVDEHVRTLGVGLG